MAEATLTVSCTNQEYPNNFLTVSSEKLKTNKIIDPAMNEAFQVLVSCGTALPETIIKIVDPKTHLELESYKVGEVWLQGPQISQGYLSDPELTQERFGAFIKGQEVLGNFYRSGDLGFISEKHELFITGRIKDLIIIHGENFYPQDFERFLESSFPSLIPTNLAAFSIAENMVEKLIVICELKAESIKKVNLNGLKKEMKAAVNRCFSVNLHDVAFIKPGTIQKTTSGKVSRALIKENYLSGELKTLASDLKKKEKKSENTYNKPAQVKTGIDSKDIKPFLINCIKNKLEGKREFIDTQKSIFFFGFDSVKIIELFHDLEKNFNCEFPVEIFFKDSSIDELAELLRLTVEGKPISH